MTARRRPAYGKVKLAAATFRAASVTRIKRNDPFHVGSSLIREVSSGESESPSFGSSRTHSFASTLYSTSKIGEALSLASNSKTPAPPGSRRMTGGVLSTTMGDESREDDLPSSGFDSASEAVSRKTYSPSGSAAVSKE